MKWVVLLLSALNLGYLGYQLSVRGNTDAVRDVGYDDESATMSTGGLALLTELSGQTLRLRRPPPAVAGDGDGSGAPWNESGPTAATNVPPSDAEPDVRCFTIGPLDAASPVQAMRRWLESRGFQARLSPRERREVALHWVFFPPLPSRDAAVAKVLEMRRKGIADMVVLRKGDMAHAISLGAFSRRESMQRRLRELRAKGYQPSTARRDYVTLALWLDVAGERSFVESGFRKAFAAANITERVCEHGEVELQSRLATTF